MKLEVGKRYRVRGGWITHPIVNTEYSVYPFTDGEEVWTADGKYYRDGRSHVFDIVDEYVEPVPVTEIDLTAIDKPLNELDDETASALFLYGIKGGKIQGHSPGGNKWIDLTVVSWNPINIYRAAPPRP